MKVLVTIWTIKVGIMLSQIKIEDRSNQITAIPKLLDMLDVKGSIKRDNVYYATEILSISKEPTKNKANMYE